MKKNFHFDQIGDFVQKMNIKRELKNPDFFIYNYDELNDQNWEDISSFRQNYYEVSLDFTVACDIKVDNFHLPKIENRLTMVGPYRTQKCLSGETKGTHQGYAVFFKPEFMSWSYHNENTLKDFTFFRPFSVPWLSLGRHEVSSINDIIARVYNEYSNFNSYSGEIIKNYLRILFLKVHSFINITGHVARISSRSEEIFAAFQMTLQKHFLEVVSVKDYAEMLNITSKHLSETVKKVSGKSALRLIHETQINHAKSLLSQTSKTVSEIAYELNFDNPDYFSFFFKRGTGKTPLEFRLSIS